MPEPITIARLVKTCDACPAQWDGFTAEGQEYYFRFRWGGLTMQEGGPAGPLVFCWEDEDNFNGYMELEELREHVAGVFVLPDAEAEWEEDYAQAHDPAA